MDFHVGLCNGLLLVSTVVVSVLAFWNPALQEKYIFDPERILAGKQYYRLITSAFLHADFRHLFLNMLSLYFFGPRLEMVLGRGSFLLIYFGSILGGSLLALYVHRNHEYRAYGASGGVCGVIFAYILLFPGASIYAFPLPLYVPAWLYAIGFLVGSFFALKAGRDNVGHDAHLGGAIVGLLLTALVYPASLHYNLRVFLTVLIAAVLLLGYLWVNPMFLPLGALWNRAARSKRRLANLPRYRRESLEVDTVLEKISTTGFESLTEEEKRLLEGVSGKFRRRAEHEKPKSGLTI
jgi:membrane associated rhomboid family serine protease